jgi:single-strand DNA-binding protein
VGWKESYNGKNWELATFWRVTTWRNLAEICSEYLTKGQLVFVEGEVNGEAEGGSQNPRVWTGNDGEPRASYEMTARVMKMLGGGGQREEHQEAESPPGFVEENDIPF